MTFSGKCFAWMVPCLIYFDCLDHKFWTSFFEKIVDLNSVNDFSWKHDIFNVLNSVPRLKCSLLQGGDSSIEFNSTKMVVSLRNGTLFDFKIIKDGTAYGI